MFFDLILTNIQIRENNHYLNIVKHLSRDLSIGFIDVPLDKLPDVLVGSKTRVTQTNELALSLLETFGAKRIDWNSPAKCRLLLVPQSIHRCNDLPLQVTFDHACAVERFGSGPAGADTLARMGVTQLWIYDQVLYDNICHSISCASDSCPLDVKEFGFPYKKFPAFDYSDVGIDYMVAEPTRVLLRDPCMRARLYANIYRFQLSKPGERYFVKRHNARDANSEHCATLKSMLRGWLTKNLPLRLLGACSKQSSFVAMMLADRYEAQVVDACKDLEDSSPYSGLGIEHFLPFVEKGIVTGITSCAWGALCAGLSIYNCDPRDSLADCANAHIYESFFNPPCGGDSDAPTVLDERLRSLAESPCLMELILAHCS